MSEFIRVEIDSQKCVGIKECGECIGVCPVNIFGEKGDHPPIIEENQDECTLCDLCVETCNPDAIAIKRLYEE
jgi:NAD-dependent dihydropyrimidine dehydrogenase PreA subunit